MKKKQDCSVTGKRIRFHLVKIICKEEKNYVCKKANQYLIKPSIYKGEAQIIYTQEASRKQLRSSLKHKCCFLNNLKKF